MATNPWLVAGACTPFSSKARRTRVFSAARMPQLDKALIRDRAARLRAEAGAIARLTLTGSDGKRALAA